MGSFAPIGSKDASAGMADRAARLAPLQLSTGMLPRAEQFAAWRDFMSPVIDVAVDSASDVGFVAEQTVWDLGSLALSHAVMPADGRVRTWRHLKRDPLDHWCLVLVTGPGGATLSMRSLAQPFEGAARDREVISLYMPRDLFRSSADSIDRLQAGIPDGPLASLLADYILSLDRRIATLTPGELPKLVEATRMLLAACLAPGPDHAAAAQEVMAVSLVDRARRIIQQNLAAPNFGPQQLCRMLGVSRSRLYRLFEPLGGVSRYIQRQRLLAAHGALSDPLNSGPIVDVAERCGFVDPSGFSRAFRQEFGYSPRHARATAALGAAPVTVRLQTLPPTPRSSLGAVLRRLSA